MTGFVVVVVLGVLAAIVSELLAPDLADWAPGAWRQWRSEYERHRAQLRGTP